MERTGWGNFPSLRANEIKPHNQSSLISYLKTLSDKEITQRPVNLIARGLGRSYGDSSLAPLMLDTEHLDTFVDFDLKTGILHCNAGVSLADILRIFVPKGWFLPVTPGTKFVSLGGAIASDVHGKNHHLHGCFSNHVQSLTLALASGDILECSPTLSPELFHATCGGMGLTGIILDAKLQLIPITSTKLNTETFKAKNLAAALELFEKHHHATYSVAWIDCLATGDSLGRSLVMLGEHHQTADQAGSQHPSEQALSEQQNIKTGWLSIPCNMPNLLLNPYSIQAFNTLYYNKVRKNHSRDQSHYEPFFYPLDTIHHWNRLYGKKGFTQYQFALPKSAGLAAMTDIIQRISHSKRGSFLAVLKALGPANNNPLSFPIEGYTLALDFKIEPGLFQLLNELDKIVLEYGGRLYLSKDARMTEDTFKASYPEWERFSKVRKEYQADTLFHSLQSKRLGL